MYKIGSIEKRKGKGKITFALSTLLAAATRRGTLSQIMDAPSSDMQEEGTGLYLEQAFWLIFLPLVKKSEHKAERRWIRDR